MSSQWSARITGAIVCGVWLVILMLWSSMEDVTPALIPLMLAIVITMGCILIAWRWGVAGGVATIVGAVAILMTGWYDFSASGRTADWYLLAITSLPFFATGLLFVVTERYRQVDDRAKPQ
jgi:hypothetical protein